MSEPITINRETFAKLSSPGGKPVRFIYRQVGDGGITEYHLTSNSDIHVTENVSIDVRSTAGRSMATARTHAEVTGSVGGNCVEQDSAPVAFAVAAQWVREGSRIDVPVIVDQA